MSAVCWTSVTPPSPQGPGHRLQARALGSKEALPARDGEQGCREAQAGGGTQSRAQWGAHLLGSAQFVPLGPRRVFRCKQRKSESWLGRRGRCQGPRGRKWERCDVIVPYCLGPWGRGGASHLQAAQDPACLPGMRGYIPRSPTPAPLTGWGLGRGSTASGTAPFPQDSGAWKRGCGAIPPRPEGLGA